MSGKRRVKGGGLKGKYLWQGGTYGSQATPRKRKTGQVLKQFEVFLNGTDVSTLAVVDCK
jgi:glucose dehydrogenase